MRDIANYRQGTFYYVSSINKADEYFADALGGLATISIKEIDI